MRVLLFSLAREAAHGKDVVRIERPPYPSDLDELLLLLRVRYPGLRRVLPRSRFAVNGEYVPVPAGDHRLRPGDEVAILPPYSGG